MDALRGKLKMLDHRAMELLDTMVLKYSYKVRSQSESFTINFRELHQDISYLIQ